LVALRIGILVHSPESVGLPSVGAVNLPPDFYPEFTIKPTTAAKSQLMVFKRD
jgi:hypothetical protein